MKASAYLINTSRGPIVDETALVEALASQRIAGAALDVFDVEPLPSAHPLREFENVILTPHLGYVTTEQYELFYGQAIENILAYTRGKLLRPLNPS
jgi:phosphoglycerate dehydrogenase-like enzyme